MFAMLFKALFISVSGPLLENWQLVNDQNLTCSLNLEQWGCNYASKTCHTFWNGLQLWKFILLCMYCCQSIKQKSDWDRFTLAFRVAVKSKPWPHLRCLQPLPLRRRLCRWWRRLLPWRPLRSHYRQRQKALALHWSLKLETASWSWSSHGWATFCVGRRPWRSAAASTRLAWSGWPKAARFMAVATSKQQRSLPLKSSGRLNTSTFGLQTKILPTSQGCAGCSSLTCMSWLSRCHIGDHGAQLDGISSEERRATCPWKRPKRNGSRSKKKKKWQMRQRHHCNWRDREPLRQLYRADWQLPFDGSEKTSWPLGSCPVACDWETYRLYPWLMLFRAIRHVGI